MVTPSMPEQSCKEIIPLLDAYFDQELNTAEKVGVEQHLAGCSGCSTRLASIELLVGSLKSMPQVKMKFDVTDMPLPTSKVVALPPRVWAAVGVAAAAVALLAVATFNGNSLKPVVAGKPASPHNHVSRENETPVEPPAVANQNPTSKQSAPHAQVAVQSARETGTANNGTVKTLTPVAANQANRRSAPNNIVNQASQQPMQLATQFAAPSAEKQEIVEVAVIEEGGLDDALGIATDEDGLYELKM